MSGDVAKITHCVLCKNEEANVVCESDEGEESSKEGHQRCNPSKIYLD